MVDSVTDPIGTAPIYFCRPFAVTEDVMTPDESRSARTVHVDEDLSRVLTCHKKNNVDL